MALYDYNNMAIEVLEICRPNGMDVLHRLKCHLGISKVFNTYIFKRIIYEFTQN